jgi:hypothetical protein
VVILTLKQCLIANKKIKGIGIDEIDFDGCNDRCRRIGNPISSGNNNSNDVQMQQPIMHHDFEASTSN